MKPKRTLYWRSGYEKDIHVGVWMMHKGLRHLPDLGG